MNKPKVTAVGRLLKSKQGEPRIHKVIAVNADGTVETVLEKPMQ
jgi:hypothetical protein